METDRPDTCLCLAGVTIALMCEGGNSMRGLSDLLKTSCFLLRHLVSCQQTSSICSSSGFHQVILMQEGRALLSVGVLYSKQVWIPSTKCQQLVWNVLLASNSEQTKVSKQSMQKKLKYIVFVLFSIECMSKKICRLSYRAIKSTIYMSYFGHVM